MIDPNTLSSIYDGVKSEKLSEESKKSCQKVAKHFNELIHKDEFNVFSSMALEGNASLSSVLKMTIPGEDVCEEIELMRKGIFDGKNPEEIAELFYNSVEKTFDYINIVDLYDKVGEDAAIEAVLAFYKTYCTQCFTLNEKLFTDVSNGLVSSFKPFFEEYLSKYREKMKDIMSITSFGADRNYEKNYRKTTYKYIEMLLTYVLVYCYYHEISSIAFSRFIKRLTKDILSDSELFYQLWLSTNNEVIDEKYSKGDFANALFDFSNTYNELIIESKKLYETNLGCAPIAKESDMRELYKTVYELQKELNEVKKQLLEVKK